MNNQPLQGPSALDREREQREREMEDQHLRERQMRMQADEMAQREREHNERERQHREHLQSIPQHQNSTGAITIHQPVANRLAGAIHSPGGLLANHGGGPPSNPLGAPSGPGNAFGGPLHADANRPMQHQSAAAQQQQQQQQHQMFGQNVLNHPAQPPAPMPGQGGQPAVFGGPLQQAEAAARSIQGMPFVNGMQGGHPGAGQQALGQGQQPILNDALSYLDQVKVQFVDQPDVYNRFLDIMKDFKSQAIDTPGVINRVSELFAGHPNLIQGFNTFLPPGYRIECGAGSDPNSIRVTTPMGTTVQTITGRAGLQEAGPGVNGGNYYGRGGAWDQRPAHSIESPEAMFSPQSRNAAPAYGQNQGGNASYESQQAAAAHQQEQRNVHHLQNAAATVGGQPPRLALTPTPGAQGGPNGGQQPGMEKRGPVEFNHAISYVNKIKNRFQDKPEIYKQFLEILQTYQRESKPIQDVYAQVTTLFSDATDLLEDFKQFLPESAAQAKAAAKAAEDSAALAMATAAQTPQPARTDVKLPVVGTFPPPSTTKAEGSKKRSRNNAPNVVPPMGSMGDVSRANVGQAGNNNKRTKITHRPEDNAPEVSPTLMPSLPEPMPPASTSASDQRDIAFFDKVKKHLSNKQSFAEFLKLCNLFTQDLIDKNVLVHKVSNFVGTNSELMEQFKNMVKYTSPDEIIDNKPKIPSGRVSLSNCRGLGPSYRLLPRRERAKTCSGRDEMCHSVLNDDWASHPTWASEDSGFVAHRKNTFEEGLHRIEEERHDYDFNIEANHKVIQLLEPIAQQILTMTKEQLQSFKMPVGLGGESQSIYKRVFKKIYGPEQGRKVATDLFTHPIAVLPTLLARLKQKDEEWRFTQREWEKIWHAQTQVMYLRSLDHMGIQVKTADKKLFSTKFILENIKALQEGQRRQNSLQGKVSQFPLSFDFSDQDVILDALRFAVLYITQSTQYNANEAERIGGFFKEFVFHFFGISEAVIHERTKDIAFDSGDEDQEDPAPAELTNGRGRRINGKKDLRRGVLDKPKNGELNRALKEDSAASGSKESTPDTGSGLEDGDDTADAQEDRSTPETVNEKWLAKNPTATADWGRPLEPAEFGAKPDAPFKRDWYNMYCNQTLLVFFTLFHHLYKRLKDLKDSEQDVAAELARDKAPKPAKQIGLIPKREKTLVEDGSETFYQQTLIILEKFLDGQWEEARFQDFMRHYYLKKGWQLYTLPELLKGICRAGGLSTSNDNKEKTPDIYAKFKQNRIHEETTYNTEITYRLSVQKLIKDGDLFLVQYTPRRQIAEAQFMSKEQHTLDLSMADRIDRWKYYMATFVRVEPTEGVNRARVQDTVLKRNLAQVTSDDASTSSSEPTGRKDIRSSENLVLRVCVNSYRILFQPNTSDWFYDVKMKEGPPESVVERRNERFTEKFERNNAWMKGLSQEAVQKVNENFTNWMQEGVLPPKEVTEA